MKRILVVEDDAMVRELFNDVLLEDGYRVFTADNGDEGIAKMEKFHPDLILLDIRMRGTTGIDLLARMNTLGLEIPVFIITGRVGMKEDPTIHFSKQVKHFLEKPVSLVDLREKVRKELSDVKVSNVNLMQKLVERPRSLSGTVLGNCVFEEFLGEGGLGVVYKAQHMGMSMPVAVKMLRPQEDVATWELENFLKEIKVLARLEDKNLIQILNAGLEQEVYYLVMRYIEGETLDQKLNDNYIFSISEAVDVVSQVAQGLGTLHSADLIHRDIKPSNIIISNVDNRVVLLDFGLAGEIQRSRDMGQKRAAEGTPHYMAPEQCLGLPLDHRTDVYNLGATFYHLIMNEPPFVEEDVFKTMMAHIVKPLTPPHQKSPLVPREISNTIVQMMEKDPAHRPQSVKAVISQLRNLAVTSII